MSAKQIKKLRPDHPLTLNTQFDLANLYEKQGAYAQAEPVLKKLTEWSLAHSRGSPGVRLVPVGVISSLIACYRSLGQPQKGTEWVPKLRALLDAQINEATAALEAAPADAAQFANRGYLHALLGHFREAVADFDRAIELAPDQHLYWHDGAVPLRLALGDVEGYRLRRTEELHRLAETKQNQGPHRVVKDACMMPLEGEDLEITLKLADRALAENGMDAMGRAYSALTKGMAEYRGGHHQEAIAWLQKSAEGSVWDRDIQSYLFQSMAYHRLGQVQQARAMIADGDSLMDRYLSGPGQSVLGANPSDWVFCQVLRREAEGLINGESSSTQPIATTQPTAAQAHSGR